MLGLPVAQSKIASLPKEALIFASRLATRCKWRRNTGSTKLLISMHMMVSYHQHAQAIARFMTARMHPETALTPQTSSFMTGTRPALKMQVHHSCCPTIEQAKQIDCAYMGASRTGQAERGQAERSCHRGSSGLMPQYKSSETAHTTLRLALQCRACQGRGRPVVKKQKHQPRGAAQHARLSRGLQA